jgi:hypothetical protein
MIHADSIPSRYASAAAAAISNRIHLLGSLGQAAPNAQGGAPQPAAPGATSLGESLSIWSLPAGFDHAVNGEAAPVQIGYWQQIFVGQAPSSYARLSVAENQQLSLDAIGNSYIAERIDAAIDWTEANVKGDYVVRLVMLPFAHTYVFWLHGKDDRAVLIDKPLGKLQPQQVYDFAAVVAAAGDALRQDGSGDFG